MSDTKHVNTKAADKSVDEIADFMRVLTTKTSGGGSEKTWQFDEAAMLENRDKILRLPLQARVLVKALIENKAAAAVGFTFTQWAQWSEDAGLETRQGGLRIVRYYAPQIRPLCLKTLK